MAGIIDRVYAASPKWAQSIGVNAFGYVWRRRRYGGVFREEVAQFVSREEFTAEEWETYQSECLGSLLVHAAREVPYYRESWRRLGLTEAAVSGFGLQQLGMLPLLEKDAVRSAPEAFLAERTRTGRLHTYHTSGTTGTPLAIRLSARTHQRVAASYEARCRRWAGVDYTMSRAMIGGRLVVPRAEANPPFWRYNAAERQLYLSAFHIAPHTAAAYAEALDRYRPDYLVGYASAHFFLARMIEERGLVVHHRPHAVLTSSEKLTPEMRATLERVYGCEVFDGYSGVEACCLASECEHHRLHVSPDVGIVELLDEEGQPVSPGEVGEIVATGLLNFDQPLIRYRTGDLAVWDDEPCPCGRAMPVLRELVGRLEDTVIGPDGREMVRFHGLFLGLPSVREGQVIQEALDHFRVRLVVEPGFGEAERRAIQERFEERLGHVRVDLEVVPEIERTHRGKYRAVISKVPRSHSAIPARNGEACS